MSEKTFLATIKAGDHVWLGNYNNTQRRMEKVERLTNTQFVIGDDRYVRSTGYRVGRSFAGTGISITGIATPVEVQQYRAETLRRNQERDAREAKYKAFDEKKAELSNLFGSEQIWVRASEYGKPEDFKFEVVVNSLDEKQVRKLAKLLANWS